MKTKTIVFIPNYVLWIRDVFLLSGHNSSGGGGGGHAHSQAGRDGNLWCGFRFLPTNSGVTTKKKFSARNLKLHLGVHLCFSSWNKITIAWGGGHRPQNLLQCHWASYFFGGTILTWRAQFSLRGPVSTDSINTLLLERYTNFLQN